MELTRRDLLKAGAAAGATLLLPGCAAHAKYPVLPMKTTRPKRALVAWFSQTGHTRRYGRLIAKIWTKQGLTVDAVDISEASGDIMSGYDLIVLGVPVYYCDVPKHIKTRLREIPRIDGTPVAAYVSSMGNNSHNTAYSVLSMLAEKGGVPAGLGTFKNMSSFPGFWAYSSLESSQLKLKDLPSEETYKQVRSYAGSILERVGKGEALDAESEVSFFNLIKGGPQYYPTKMMITRHAIDTTQCIQCGTCQRHCPVQAIDYQQAKIDHGRCMLCFGCLNNCPAEAIDMALMGRKLTSFRFFLKRNQITITEPEELIS